MGKPRRQPLRPRIDFLEQRTVMSTGVIYVDADVAAQSRSPVRDGSSWADALPTLQQALDLASTESTPTQIWIAEGTYTPTKVYSPLDAQGVPVAGGVLGVDSPNLRTFDLPNGVSLFGGFKYGMTSLSQARPNAYPTTLSGDLGGNDVSDASAPGYAASKTDNAWHVVTAGDDLTQTGVSVSLHGLRIVDGYADGANDGGTLSPFVYGHSDGGGVYAAWGSTVVLDHDTFQGNFAASDGGGVFANTSNLIAEHSTFLDNSAITRAGGLEGLNDFENGVSHTSLVLDDLFQGNTCKVFGGAVVGEGAAQGSQSTMIVSGSRFVGNVAAEGAAVTIDTLNVTIASSTFKNNIALVDAGAVATTNVVGTLVGVEHDFTTTIVGSTFQGNVAEANPAAHAALNNFSGAPGLDFASGGGALVTYMNGRMVVDGDTFVGNVAGKDGGAILNGDSSANLAGISAFAVETTVRHSTFRDNLALLGSGGAIASEPDGVTPAETAADTTLFVSGSTFTGNSAADAGGAAFLGDSTATITSITTAHNRAAVGANVDAAPNARLLS